jgi:prepilin-type N-terminal cleavage/methylation domain-containing protein
MSERISHRRDAGMTLPEVLISISVIGIIATVVTASIIVTLRVNPSTDGRLNVASAEQSVAVWLPADLASATEASTEPGASPCGAAVCDGEPLDGSNALMVSWPDGGGTTSVAYIYGLSDDGETYDLRRVECGPSGACESVTMLRDLPGPDPATWVPGVTPVPSEVINVALPLAADAVDESEVDATSNARRIVVTIDGGGGSDGAGGGLNRISITAGGTSLAELEPTKVTGPSFLQASSRCGGPITIIVDDSGSIGNAGASSQVETAVKEFVKALAGTPTQVQIIRFSTKSHLIDPHPPGYESMTFHDNQGDAWNYYYDMTDAAVVEDLTRSSGIIDDGLVQSGGTNWEDAVYRTFYAPAAGDDGKPKNLAADGDPSTHLPNLVVFFTDGEPTFNRAYSDLGGSYNGSNITSGGPLFPPGSEANDEYWPLATGNVFDQEGWNRSLYLLNPFLNREDIKVIGVGVGGIATNDVYSFTREMLDDARGRYGQHNGIVYRSGDGAYERYYSPSGSLPNNSGNRDSRLYNNVSAERALGNLMAGAHPTAGKQYVEATYSGGVWQNFDPNNTDLLSTSNWSALGQALTQIALGECGGTVTLQTKRSDGSIAQADVTYNVDLGTGVEQVTTSQISRAAAVDMKFPVGATQVATQIAPYDLDVAGYTATGWSCSSKGAPLGGSQWSLVDAGDPAQGIDLTVNANQAISCTMTVA